VTDVLAFLRARYDEREAWALAASKPYPYAAGDPPIPSTGVHWEWVAGDEWEAVTLDPAVSEYVADGDPVRLATRETWPSSTRPDDPRWQMRRTYSEDAQEMDSAAAGHIAFNDPAYVLADIAAKRLILDAYATEVRVAVEADEFTPGVNKLWGGGRKSALAEVVHLLALPFAAHPDYRQKWAPSGKAET